MGAMVWAVQAIDAGFGKLTAQSDGAVRLAKMNIDEHPAVAQQLQVQIHTGRVCL